MTIEQETVDAVELYLESEYYRLCAKQLRQSEEHHVVLVPAPQPDEPGIREIDVACLALAVVALMLAVTVVGVR